MICSVISTFSVTFTLICFPMLPHLGQGPACIGSNGSLHFLQNAETSDFVNNVDYILKDLTCVIDQSTGNRKNINRQVNRIQKQHIDQEMVKKFFDISVVNQKNGTKLKITDRFGRGEGLNQDPESALIRPYKKFLDDKSSIGSVKYICINENGYYILGSFVYTVTKRILFFPATKAKKIVRSMGNPIKKNDSNNLIENLDHITLEPNFRTWHVKLFDRETWYPTQQTREIDNSLFLWAQFQVKSLTELEKLPERNEIYLEIPNEPLELASILPTIRDSRDNAINVIPFDEKIDQSFFWVFQIFVSKSKEKIFPDLYPTRIN